MKIPFIDYNLYCDFVNKDKYEILKTSSRSTSIISKFVGHTFSIHNGKKTDNITIVPAMVGQKLGSFVLTKKFGNSIHNSDHNRKVKEKARRKITQKKVRKTSTSKTSSKAKKSNKK